MALALTVRALTRPGDVIAVEHPGYRPAWEAFRIAGAEIVPVPVDEHGLDVEALQRVLARRPIRAVYVTPHHQYPTTVTLSAARRGAPRPLSRPGRFGLLGDHYRHEVYFNRPPAVAVASRCA